MKILYIEDNPIFHLLAKETLGQHFTIIAVETASEAFASAKQHQFDLFLIDLNLNDPLIDGFGVISQLKQFDNQTNAVFVAHTNYVGTIWENKCKKSGFDLFIPKPLDLAEFQSIITNFKNGKTNHSLETANKG